MKLEFWLDYLSPLCYKQHQVIEQLLKKYEFNDFELLYRSYEMIPSFEPTKTCSLSDVLEKHYVLTKEEAQEQFNQYLHLKPVKVIDAHRLSHLAKKQDKAFEFNKLLFKAYYIENKDISSREVLTYLAKKAKLDLDTVDHVLSTDLFYQQVYMNRENAILKGIHEVPHIRIDGKVRLMGYHTEAQLLDALTKASITFVKCDYCEGENCERKKTP